MRLLSMVAALAAGTVMACAQTQRCMSLDDAFALLEQNNTALHAEQTAVVAAAEGVAVARRQQWPDIATSLAATYNGNVVFLDRHFRDAHGYSSPRWGNTFALQVSQTLYAGGALRANVKRAALQKEQYAASSTLTRQQLRFLVVGHYLDLATLSHQQQVYESNIALTEALLRDINAKYEEGMALKNDITRYELQLATLRLGLRKVEDMRAVKNNTLCVALGIDNTTIIPDSTSLAQLFVPDDGTLTAEQHWHDEALLSSPQLRLAALGTSLAAQDVRLARSEYLPKVSLFAADNFLGPIDFEVPIINQNMNIWYVGVGLSWQVSALYKSNKKVRQTKLQLQESRQREREAAEDIGTAVYEAYTAYQQAFVEWDTEKKSVALAEENYAVVAERYLNQLVLITDMVDAANIRLSAELSEVDARINIIYSYYKMKYVSGTL